MLKVDMLYMIFYVLFDVVWGLNFFVCVYVSVGMWLCDLMLRKSWSLMDICMIVNRVWKVGRFLLSLWEIRIWKVVVCFVMFGIVLGWLIEERKVWCKDYLFVSFVIWLYFYFFYFLNCFLMKFVVFIVGICGKICKKCWWYVEFDELGMW